MLKIYTHIGTTCAHVFLYIHTLVDHIYIHTWSMRSTLFMLYRDEWKSTRAYTHMLGLMREISHTNIYVEMKHEKKKIVRHALRPMLCAVNGNKQRLKIMRMSIKCYYLTQVGYVSTRLLFIYMYMYTYMYVYYRRRISCFGNLLCSNAVRERSVEWSWWPKSLYMPM